MSDGSAQRNGVPLRPKVPAPLQCTQAAAAGVRSVPSTPPSSRGGAPLWFFARPKPLPRPERRDNGQVYIGKP